ncbi:hypothetical protein [Salmonella phage SD-1_S14]|nr:hypothetical protein [Salmonella phage SD-1_S14]
MQDMKRTYDDFLLLMQKKSVKNDNPKKFKKEIMNSLWYRQVTNRADLLLSSL